MKNVPNNNGKVGMFGVSYDGLTTALTLLQPHPALKAISEQASPVDQWMNDDDHRYGALRESYAFEYAVFEQADKNENTHFDFDTYDTYSWYLELGPLSNINAKYLHGHDSLLERHRRAPRLRRVLEAAKRGSAARRRHGAESQRRRLLGSGGSVGTVADLSPRGATRSGALQLHGRRSVVPRRWQWPKADSIGLISFGGHETAREFREKIEAPFFRYYLHGKGEKPAWQATTFQTGSNSWQTYAVVAAEGRRGDESLSARRRHAVVRAPRARPKATGSTSPIRPTRCRIAQRPDFADLSRRRLADLGSGGPAVRRWTARRADLCQRAARSRISR